MRVATFNVNQFDPPAHQKADLLERMKTSDVVLCQETVDLDLEAFAKDNGWHGFQVRNGDNDGHANTGVLWRTGAATATDCVFLGDVDGTRARFLAGVKLAGVWYWAVHIFPGRDKAGIPEQLHNLTAWLKAHPGKHVGGLDRNQCPTADLRRATGLKWHGVGIDGFLTNLPTSDPMVFAKGFSDHQGVHAVVTTPTAPRVRKHRIPQATDLLRAALTNANAHGKQEKASRISRALNALTAAVKAKPRPGFPAITAARKQSHEGPRFGVGLCLQRVRICFGIPALAGDATAA
jgi:endonuclease/exonuclease/phosphatase family protein